MKLLVLSLCLASVFTGCTEKNEPLKVKAMPIQGAVDGHILSGPSVLNDPDEICVGW